MLVVCAGAGGFIGGHLVKSLIESGHDVVGVDVKPLGEWYQLGHNNHQIDLREYAAALSVMDGADEVFLLAADMGGMGFLASHRVDCLHSVDITSSVIRASHDAGVGRLFYASSACVYPDFKQQVTEVSLKETDAWPADPEPAYGLEKLYGEEFCRWYRQEQGMETRVARYHNVYGPHGTYDGGREKAPAAICRKVIEAKLSGDRQIEIWGDGQQTRSFMEVQDCVEGTLRILRSDFCEPLNLGSDRLISVNDLVTMVEGIAGITLKRNYNLAAPQGVRGRNSDNTLLQSVLGWVPQVTLETGMEKLYSWIYDEVSK